MRMLKFRNFIKESDDKLTHLTHLEDRVIDHGSEGFKHAVTHLYSVHDKLKGRTRDRSTTTVKKDGAPSVVFGTHPETGKFFIGTKSVFNKIPKINYSNQDIEANHGHAPGLVEKLKHGLKHLPKITPKGKVYQGDLMYTKDDVKSDGKNYKFKPNTIEYSTPKNSQQGKKIARAHVGIAVHTQYHSDDNKFSSLKASFTPDIHNFKDHPDAHLISHHYDFEDPKYQEHHQTGFKQHIEKAKEAHSKMSSEDYNTVTKHSPHLNMYINKTVKETDHDPIKPGLNLSAEKYKGFLKDRSENHKSPSERKKSLEAFHEVSKNPHSFNKAFEVHHHLTRAKENLIHALNHRQSFGHKIDGVKTNPEGYVDTINHNGKTVPSKFVLRQEFAKQNFRTGKPNA